MSRNLIFHTDFVLLDVHRILGRDETCLLEDGVELNDAGLHVGEDVAKESELFRGNYFGFSVILIVALSDLR
jgi:hypothetical protein